MTIVYMVLLLSPLLLSSYISTTRFFYSLQRSFYFSSLSSHLVFFKKRKRYDSFSAMSSNQQANSTGEAAESHLIIGTSSKYRINAMKRAFIDTYSTVLNIPPDIDEKAYRAETAQELVTLIATKKLEAVKEKYKETVQSTGNGSNPRAIIVTADQVALLGQGESSPSPPPSDRAKDHPRANVDYTAIREKPESLEENREFLRSYSNRSVITVGATAVCDVWADVAEVGLHFTETFFGPISEDVIERILQRGVSMTTCGGFVVEDEDLSKCVTHIDGTIEEVQGLSIPLVESLLAKVKAQCPQ